MNARRFNWPIWAGFLLSLIAFLSYFFVFVWFPVTRDFPWANLLLFAIAAGLLLVGVRRAFSTGQSSREDSPPKVGDRPRPRRSKIAATVLTTLSVAIFGFFIFSIFIMARRLPASHSAPRISQRAPDFTLSDMNGRPVSLLDLLTSPVNGKAPRGVLLVFYRGYW